MPNARSTTPDVLSESSGMTSERIQNLKLAIQDSVFAILKTVDFHERENCHGPIQAIYRRSKFQVDMLSS